MYGLLSVRARRVGRAGWVHAGGGSSSRGGKERGGPVEGLDARTPDLVVVAVVLAGKATPAEVALERLLAGVGAEVAADGAAVGAHVAALAAKVDRLAFLVAPAHQARRDEHHGVLYDKKGKGKQK